MAEQASGWRRDWQEAMQEADQFFRGNQVAEALGALGRAEGVARREGDGAQRELGNALEARLRAYIATNQVDAAEEVAGEAWEVLGGVLEGTERVRLAELARIIADVPRRRRDLEAANHWYRQGLEILDESGFEAPVQRGNLLFARAALQQTLNPNAGDALIQEAVDMLLKDESGEGMLVPLLQIGRYYIVSSQPKKAAALLLRVLKRQQELYGAEEVTAEAEQVMPQMSDFARRKAHQMLLRQHQMEPIPLLETRHLLGQALFQAGEYDGSLEQYDVLRDQVNAQMALQQQARETGNPPEALRLLMVARPAVSTFQDPAQFAAERGECLLVVGQDRRNRELVDKARQSFEVALKYLELAKQPQEDLKEAVTERLQDAVRWLEARG